MSVKAYQTQLRYRQSTAAFTALARVKSIKPNKLTQKDIDTTVLESANEMTEVLAGLGDGGEMEVTIEYDKTQTGALYALWRDDADFQIKYPDNSGWTVAGFLSEIGDEEVANGEILMTTIKIRVSGLPVPAATVPAS